MLKSNGRNIQPCLPCLTATCRLAVVMDFQERVKDRFKKQNKKPPKHLKKKKKKILHCILSSSLSLMHVLKKHFIRARCYAHFRSTENIKLYSHTN